MGIYVSMYKYVPFMFNYSIGSVNVIFSKVVFVFMIFILSVTVPYVCPVFSRRFEYPELLLLLLMARMCSSYLILNILPVCPTYFSGKSKNLILYMPFLLYLSVYIWDFHIFYIVSCMIIIYFVLCSVWKKLFLFACF